MSSFPKKLKMLWYDLHTLLAVHLCHNLANITIIKIIELYSY